MAVDDSLKRPTYAKRNLLDLVASVTAMPEEVETEAEPVAEDGDSPPPPKKSDPLPKPGDRYRAHARFLNRLSSDPKFLHFVHGDLICDGFAYHDLRRISRIPADRPGHGPSLVLRFIEAVIIEVTVSGRNLDDLHYYISEGSMPWVWEQPKGFKTSDDRTTVITGIKFCEMEK